MHIRPELRLALFLIVLALGTALLGSWDEQPARGRAAPLPGTRFALPGQQLALLTAPQDAPLVQPTDLV